VATGPTAATVHVRLFAGAADAVGGERLELRGVTNAGELVDAICAGRDGRVRLVLDQCSLLIDGNRVSSPATPIAPGATVDVLPPFAGG